MLHVGREGLEDGGAGLVLERPGQGAVRLKHKISRYWKKVKWKKSGRERERRAEREKTGWKRGKNWVEEGIAVKEAKERLVTKKDGKSGETKKKTIRKEENIEKSKKLRTYEGKIARKERDRK